MNCPNGWTECELCKYYRLKQCEYDFAEEKVDLKEIAAEVEKSVARDARESGEKLIKKRELEEGSLEWFYSMKPPDNNVLEPINAMSGAIVLGGGSKSGGKKSKKGNKPTVYVWGQTT